LLVTERGEVRLLIHVLCIACLVSSTVAGQESEVDASLPSYRPVAGVTGTIAGHGSAAMSGPMGIWAAAFERIYPSVRVRLDDESQETAGAGAAATFGPFLEKMQEPLISEFTQRYGYAAMEVPVCRYALAVFVQNDNPYKEGLPIEEVEKIFSGRFKDVTWGDLGCGGERSKRSISLYAPRHHADALIESCCGSRLVIFKRSVSRQRDDATVVDFVASDAYGIGVASIGCLTEKVRALAIAPKGSADFFLPTVANMRSGSYPLAGTFYLELNHDQKGVFELDPLRREFLRYILSKEGQQGAAKAGYAPLSAEQAEQALTQFGIRPTGEGAWEEMRSRLAARHPPGESMTLIQQLVGQIGDRPTDRALAQLERMLARTGLTSSVTFATDKKGATMKFRSVGQPTAVLSDNLPSGTKVTVPVGLYYVWTERNGKPTSPTDALFPVVREEEGIKVYETP
jgi:phosphate transport system substrate-binding protein